MLRAIAYALLAGVFVATVFCLTKWGRESGGRLRLRRWLEGAETTGEPEAWSAYLRFGATGFVLVVLTMGALEIADPLFFTQDDNHSSFLPIILQGCRALFSGVFPTWNPYQYLGAPTTSIGLYALLYPFTYLSYAVARFLLGNEQLTMEVFCIGHVLGAYCSCLDLTRRLRFSPPLAVGATLCLALSGFQLVVGRSWYYMLPVATWFPCLLILWMRLRATTAPGWRWAMTTASVIALWFHAGNTQMWVYGMLFLAVQAGLWVTAGGVPRGRLVTALSAGLLGLALCLPLGALQSVEMRDRPRMTEGRMGIANGTVSLFFPPPVYSGFPGVEDGRPSVAAMYSTGVVPAFAWLAALLTMMTVARHDKNIRGLFADQTWTLLAAIAFVLALGDHGILWRAFGSLPVFDKFSRPYKLQGFLAIFLILAGATFVRAVAKAERWRLQVVTALAAAAVGLTLWNAAFAPRAAFARVGDKGYPPLPPELAEILSLGPSPAGRVWPVGPDRNSAANYTLNLLHHYPTAYSIASLKGYDTTAERAPAYVEALTKARQSPALYLEYGVRWIVSSRAWPFDRDRTLIPLEPRLVGTWRGLTVHEVSGARPLVFEPEGGRPVDFTLRADGIDIVADGQKRVVANFLHRAWMQAHDERGRRLAIVADELGRMVIESNGAIKVALRYRLEWLTGVVAGLAVALIACLVMAVGVRYGSLSPSET